MIYIQQYKDLLKYTQKIINQINKTKIFQRNTNANIKINTMKSC